MFPATMLAWLVVRQRPMMRRTLGESRKIRLPRRIRYPLGVLRDSWVSWVRSGAVAVFARACRAARTRAGEHRGRRPGIVDN